MSALGRVHIAMLSAALAAALCGAGCNRPDDRAAVAEKQAAATYHLTGQPDVNFRDHVGRQVEVSGVLNAQQRIATRTTQDPAPNATGTSGSPQVSSATQLDVKRLEVKSIKPLAGACET